MARVWDKYGDLAVAVPIRENAMNRNWLTMAKEVAEGYVTTLLANREAAVRVAEPEEVGLDLTSDEMLARASGLIGFGTIKSRFSLIKTALKWFGLGAAAGDVLDPTERLGKVNLDVEVRPFQGPTEPGAPVDGAVNASMAGAVDYLPFLSDTMVGIYLGKAMLGVVTVGCFRGLVDGMNMVTRSNMRAVIVKGA